MDRWLRQAAQRAARCRSPLGPLSTAYPEGDEEIRKLGRGIVDITAALNFPKPSRKIRESEGMDHVGDDRRCWFLFRLEYPASDTEDSLAAVVLAERGEERPAVVLIGFPESTGWSFVRDTIGKTRPAG